MVEAAIASGSLITARLAGEQGRDVFAIPGSIHSPLSKGCHQLIKQGAKLVESAEDILCELGLSLGLSIGQPQSPRTSTDANIREEDEVLAAMGYDPVSLDELMARTKLAADTLSARLMELEIQGAVCVVPGGKFQRMQ